MIRYQYVTSIAISKYVQTKYQANLVRWRFMDNGALLVIYSREVNKKSVRCCTFVSQKSIAKSAVAVMAERSRDVVYKILPGAVVGHAVLNEQGKPKYHCNYKFCTCPSYSMNQLETVLGFRICKHVIGSSKLDRIAFTLEEWLKVRRNEENI